ncbi:MAG: hypothetical protein AAF467_28155 [Actinomycetota bacterium]
MTTAPSSRQPVVIPPAVFAELDDAVLATVAYSDVFDMPISIARLHRFLVGAPASRADVSAVVDDLVAQDRLGRRDDLAYLAGRSEVLTVHDERAVRAEVMWGEAERWARWLARVPCIRMVAVTGGLAVDSVAPHDDIDYFIITRPGRLWLTRLLVLVVARLAARDGSELCPNYMVTDRALDMDDRALYVARELAQMVPVVSAERCTELRRRNAWLLEYLPNASLEGDTTHEVNVRPGVLTRLAELVFISPLFTPLERWERRRKIAKLQTVRSRRPEVGRPDESSFSADVCKGHMLGNAAGIDVAWQSRLDDRSVPAASQASVAGRGGSSRR